MNVNIGQLLLRVSTLLAVVFMVSTAVANPDAERIEKAGALYEKGRRAHDAGEHEDAARAFADADALVPDAAALEAALVAVLKTQRAALGMELAERSKRVPNNKTVAKLAERTRAKFREAAGRIMVTCDACVVLIDAVPQKRGESAWVSVGEHEVVIRDGDAQEKRTVRVEAGAVVTILPIPPGERPPPNPAENEPSPKPTPKDDDQAKAGPTTAWFWIAFAATAAVGVGAGISAIDTASKHAEFEEEPTDERAVEGEAAQTRTNVLLGVTGGLAVVTAVVGLFIVDWNRDDVALGPGGLRIRF